MQTAEIKRFFEYVELTSRPGPPTERRQAMSAALTGRSCASAQALVASVKGNSKDRVWVSDAIKAGRIVRYGESLGLPSARYGADQAGSDQWFLDFNRLCVECPMLTEDTCFRLQQTVAIFFHELDAQNRVDSDVQEDNDNDE